jgi:glycosyltransferase involved in cell wall biosynthesis
MRILHVLDSVNAEVGGPSESVPGLADALMSHCDAVVVAAHDYACIGPARRARRAAMRLVESSKMVSRLHGLSTRFRRAVFEEAARVDVVHGHGVWIYANHVARTAAGRFSHPLVISTRGMLAPWSRKHLAWKKSIAWGLYARRDLDACAVFHATSTSEAEAIHALGFRQPVAVIPNGVQVPVAEDTVPRAVLEGDYPALKGKRWVLFLSRLHPKKGVSELIGAWRQVRGVELGWHLIVAGGDIDGYGKRYASEIETAGLSDSVTLCGRLDGERRSCALWNAELSVLPTYTENFGMAVAEALAHGVPVITTRQAPWGEVAERECGWWIETGADALAEALGSALAMAPDTLESMGRRGRELVAERYSWDAAAGKMADVYRWCLGGRGGNRPESMFV